MVVGRYIVVKGGRRDIGHAGECPGYYFVNVVESYAVAQECCHGYLIGCVDYTCRVALLFECVVGKAEAWEFLCIGFLECQCGIVLYSR